MTTPRIAIIIGSTRPGRAGAAIGRWVHEQAQQRDDASYELVDLADFDLSLLNEALPLGAANRNYENPNTRAWSQEIDKYDGYVFVTPEYNHGVPAALKNAVDVLYPEWADKAVGFVGYGYDGGVRAIEQWRQIMANFRMTDVRAQVSLSLITDVKDGEFSPAERRAGEVGGVLDQLVPMASLLRQLRD